MIHGLKVSISKGTAKREILEADESHSVTESTLVHWKTALKSLHDALAANENAWRGLLGTYTNFHVAAAAMYSERDVEARGVLKTLDNGRTAVEAPPASEPGYSPMQQVELARQEITTMLARIENAEALHTKRFETTRQYKYYDRKTKQMLLEESKRSTPVPAKNVDRRSRNQKKVMDLAIQLNSTTTQLYTELEYIDMERLAITDRAVAAMLMLQKYYYDANASKNAYVQGDKIRLGRRVIPRDEVRPWMPNTLQPANPNPQVSNTGMVQSVPAITAGPQPTAPASKAIAMQQPPLQQHLSQQQPYPQQQMSNGVAQYYAAPAQQPNIQHVPSAPPVNQPVYSQPQYGQPVMNEPADVQYAQAVPEPPTDVPQPPGTQQQYSQPTAVGTTQQG